MGHRGRYGKYGETKRFNRLRKARKGLLHANQQEQELSYSTSYRSKSFLNNRIKIVPAGLKDADYIRGLSKKVFNKYGSYDDTLANWFISGLTLTLLVSTGKRKVGFAMLGRAVRDDPLSRVYELLAIAIEPDMQKLGIGSFLLDEIEKKARELLVETLILHTAADNAAGRKLFKRHGFVTSETKGGFYPGGQDAVMMYKKFNTDDSD